MSQLAIGHLWSGEICSLDTESDIDWNCTYNGYRGWPEFTFNGQTKYLGHQKVVLVPKHRSLIYPVFNNYYRFMGLWLQPPSHHLGFRGAYSSDISGCCLATCAMVRSWIVFSGMITVSILQWEIIYPRRRFPLWDAWPFSPIPCTVPCFYHGTYGMVPIG